MAFPVVISLPYQGAEHRDALQRRIIDAIDADPIADGCLFRDNLRFYPYYNRTSMTLTPSQLYEVLDQELDFFLPEEALHDLQYKAKRRNFRQPLPANDDKLQESEFEHQEWDSDRFAIVVDDEELRHVRFFQVNEFDVWRRLCRRRLKAGETLSEDQTKWGTDGNSDEECGRDEQGSGRQNSNDDGQEDVLPDFPYRFAAKYLGRPTAKWYRLRGILATRMEPTDVVPAVINLEQANMDFNDFIQNGSPTPEWEPEFNPPVSHQQPQQ